MKHEQFVILNALTCKIKLPHFKLCQKSIWFVFVLVL